MNIVRMIAIGLLIMPLAEIAVFFTVAHAFGFAIALILVILVSLLGILVLSRAARSTTSRMRMAAPSPHAGVLIQGNAATTAIAGILLVIPGFITGLLGASVMVPMCRRGMVALWRRSLSGNRQTPEPGVLDLAPDEWRSLPSQNLPPRRTRPRR